MSSESLVFKLCDFGSVRKVGEASDNMFTKTYAAPELSQKGSLISGLSDVYSFGLVLMQGCLGIKQCNIPNYRGLFGQLHWKHKFSYI